MEIKEFFREKDAVIFTAALPAVMLILFAAIFHFKAPGTNVPAAEIYTTGLMAGGVASTSFVSMAVAIAVERDTGGLKRLAGTPMPRSAYFIGKVIRVIVLSVIEIATPSTPITALPSRVSQSKRHHRAMVRGGFT